MFILLVRITSKRSTIDITGFKKSLASYFLRSSHYRQFTTNLNSSSNKMEFYAKKCSKKNEKWLELLLASTRAPVQRYTL